jgi:hypothetical protein
MRLLAVLSLFFAADAFAAACCGGGAAFPNLILGDFKSQLGLSASYGDVIGSVSAAGQSVFRRSDNLDLTDAYRLDGSLLAGDYWQLGASVAMVGRTRKVDGARSSSRGLGDVSASAAYEFLPVVYYSAWKPRGFIFARLGIPTAPSIDDIRLSAVEARGSGFFSGSLGVAFTKNVGSMDFEILAEGVQRFSRSLEQGTELVAVAPAPSFNALAGMGYTPDAINKLRVGASLGPRYLGKRTTTRADGRESVSNDELVWDTTASAHYLLETELSAGIIYLDQTLFGPARSTVLQRSIGLSVQKRWSL